MNKQGHRPVLIGGSSSLPPFRRQTDKIIYGWYSWMGTAHVTHKLISWEMTIVNILKSLLIWLCFIPLAILNGGLRDYVLVRIIGERWALPTSGILLSIAIYIVSWLLLPRIIKRCSTRDCWLIGTCWATLTVAFEFTAGLASGHSLTELLAAYNPLTGNLWLLVVGTTFLSPISIKRKRL